MKIIPMAFSVSCVRACMRTLCCVYLILIYAFTNHLHHSLQCFYQFNFNKIKNNWMLLTLIKISIQILLLLVFLFSILCITCLNFHYYIYNYVGCSFFPFLGFVSFRFVLFYLIFDWIFHLLFTLSLSYTR